MKLLFIQDALINAGSEKSHLEIISRFSSKTQKSLAYFYPYHDLKDSYNKAGIPLHFLNLKGRYDFITGCWRLIKLIKKEKPDIMVSCLLRSNLMARVASFITGVPLVGTWVSDSYGEAKMSSKSSSGQFKFRIFQKLDQLTSSIPVHWIANSNAILNSNCAVLKVDKNKTSVVYRGRSVSSYEAWVGGSAALFTFISVGRLMKGKGLAELIHAFKQVIQSGMDCRLVIYGEGTFRKELEDLVRSNDLENYVKMPGNILQVAGKLKEAHAFVFPSWFEGFSGALVEAMMTGIPIIASDIPMNLEAITPGVNALSFQVKNVDDLVAKMKYVFDHREEMSLLGLKARAEAIARFDINVIAAQYEDVLYRVLEQSKGKTEQSH